MTRHHVRTINYTNQFKKDFKLIQKQNKDLDKIKTVIAKLAADEILDEKFKDHALQGNYAGTRDCHINPDWLLIYAIVGNELRLIRTGSHAELFE
ncbi:MAG: type II toxin-antitoxin system YafQ family toxin [Chloroflexota bacterium]